jgi:hypothetical protein
VTFAVEKGGAHIATHACCIERVLDVQPKQKKFALCLTAVVMHHYLTSAKKIADMSGSLHGKHLL